MRKLTLGLFAHVDAGKTSLAEAMLYTSGARRALGRVDKQDAFLDTHALERSRGITIFLGQARFAFGDTQFTLLDTPGHTDFSAETERAMQVLDAAVLIVSGPAGVQSHTRTLWRLLARYGVPTFVFVNKMDSPDVSAEEVLAQMREILGDGIVDFSRGTDGAEFAEEAALCGEELMETVLAGKTPDAAMLRRAVTRREIFPCYFGSATRCEGADALLAGLDAYGPEPAYEAEPGGRVYKITHEDGVRVTHLKVLGGTLKVRDVFPGTQEKIGQIRRYAGGKYELVTEAAAGEICGIPGLSDTRAGQAFGSAPEGITPALTPVLRFDILLPEGLDAAQAWPKLREIGEEQPEMAVSFDERSGRIRALLMGKIQCEVLRDEALSRFGWEIGFADAGVAYRETIAAPAEGVGHYEPLRHYAEVHLLLEPGAPGSGLVFGAAVRTDDLEERWQRLILTHLKEKEHLGVLTGAPVTDMRITLIAGRAHEKHTEGGDFRQATYRAVRQGLMEAGTVLLEPVYAFTLAVPERCVGRAMTDIERRGGSFSAPHVRGGEAVLEGKGPAATLQNYQAEVSAYTGGEGHFSVSFAGYEPCRNAEEVAEQTGYDAEADTDNPCGSIFCSHGAGYYVPWDEVPSFMHVDSGLGYYRRRPAQDEFADAGAPAEPERSYASYAAENEELKAIFERTYGPVKVRVGDWDRPPAPPRPEKPYVYKERKPVKEYLLVDGYNVIFAWPDLNALAAQDLGAARGKLLDILADYRGMRGCEIILVFDAYRVQGHAEEVFSRHDVYVVYTREAETADRYIERTAHEIGHRYRVTVATSDGVEQVIIRGAGCALLSARDLAEEIARAKDRLREEHLDKHAAGRVTVADALSEEARRALREAAEEERSGGASGI
ncbi:MAG: TetM/TetW/TetO/TetS family tetracycline resistance ribosomal protection protein [Lachnospiraceae bacterium]|nr:TetM/TetW/TetO/TetS family tetracycline resistance ribosomal protection protein [Lachnospiraceae bacterium]